MSKPDPWVSYTRKMTVMGVLILAGLAFCLFFLLTAPAKCQTSPKNWVDESLNKTIVVTPTRTYTLKQSGTTVIQDRGIRNHQGMKPRSDVIRDYGPGYRNDEAAQSGLYGDFKRTSPRR